MFANRGFAHPRMWSQYADDGQGVCLVLNYEALEKAVARSVGGRYPWGRGAVSNGDLRHELSLGFYDARDLLDKGPSEAVLQNFEESLLTKHQDWSHEAEFRFFVMDGTDDDWVVPLSDDVVAGVIVGPRFRGVNRSRNVRAFSRSFGAAHRVRQLHWTHGRPELVPF